MDLAISATETGAGNCFMAPSGNRTSGMIGSPENKKVRPSRTFSLGTRASSRST
jgi:hypothetical protein